MSTKFAHGALVVIVATIAAALSISIATANPAGAEPHQIPADTSHQTHHGYTHARYHPGSHTQITDPNRIFPGQVVNIPKPAATTYVVRRGDTLSGIAKKFGVSLAAVESANHVGGHRGGWQHAGPAPR